MIPRKHQRHDTKHPRFTRLIHRLISPNARQRKRNQETGRPMTSKTAPYAISLEDYAITMRGEPGWGRSPAIVMGEVQSGKTAAIPPLLKTQGTDSNQK